MVKLLYLVVLLTPICWCLKVEEDYFCTDGFYFDKEKDQCQKCQRCPIGYQPTQSCDRYQSSKECEVCPVGTYNSRDDSWTSCRSHTSCADRHRTLHAAGNSIRDNTCGQCLAGYTEITAMNGESFCWACDSVENPPVECEGYMGEEEATDTTEKVTDGDPEGAAGQEGSNTGIKDAETGGESDERTGGNGGNNDNELMLLLLVILFGFFLLIAVFVLIALLIIRVAKRDIASESVLSALCPFSGSVKKPRSDEVATDEKKSSGNNPANDTVVLPEVIVAQHPGRNMYSRQLSDTIVQLKLFELKPSDMLPTAQDTTSNEDLLELLSARSPEEQIKWKVHMLQKIYGDAQTWSLAPEVKQKLTRYFLSLDKSAQVQLGRALVDIFKIDTTNKKLKMDELVKLVINNSETTVYSLVKSTFENCMDLRVIDAICDELFTSRKRAQQNINLHTIMEANA